MNTQNEILDTIIGCERCGYYTCNKRDFARHITTKKHLQKLVNAESNENAATPLKGIRGDAKPIVDKKPPSQGKQQKKNEAANSVIPKPKRKYTKKKGGDTTHVMDADYDEFVVLTDTEEDDNIYETIYTNPELVLENSSSLLGVLFLFLLNMYGTLMNILFEPISDV